MDDDAPVSREGRLLVAAPTLVDPHFHRAVVLMLEHTAEGALGLILNRPLDLVARDTLPEDLGGLLPEVDHLHEGGPVQPDAIIVLAEFDDPGEAAGIAFGQVGIVDPGGELVGLDERTGAARAFGGYAGWSGGQLEEEIADGAWIDAPATVGDVFSEDTGHLWADVLARKGGTWRIIARMPVDPTVN
ncbi:MAG: YqgE/AlgH family protein [Miltoncostaeaceae bacterium]